MSKCKNPGIGKLISRYEFNLLSEDERKLFEAHLLECDACSEDLYSMLDVVKTIKEKPDVVINALRENIDKHSKLSLAFRIKEMIINLNYSLITFISSMFFEHRLAAISATAFIVLILFSIALWKTGILNKYSTQPSLELTEHKTEKIDSTLIKRKEKPSAIPESKQLAEKSKQPEEKIIHESQRKEDIASLAEIQYEPYSSLLSMNEKQRSAEIEKFFDEGIEYYKEKNFRQAIVSLSQLDETMPNYSEAQFYLGMSYLLLKDYNRGIIYLQKASVSGNKIIEEKSHWYLANAYLIKGEGKSALDELQIVDKLNGEHKNKAEEIIKEIK